MRTHVSKSQRMYGATGSGSIFLALLVLASCSGCSHTAIEPPKRADVIRHLSIYQSPSEYCAWPSLARTSGGDLIVLFTRSEEHLGPDGAILLSRSTDNGKTWLSPAVVLDSPIDDRESGITTLRDGSILGHFWSTFQPKCRTKSCRRMRTGATCWSGGSQTCSGSITGMLKRTPGHGQPCPPTADEHGRIWFGGLIRFMVGLSSRPVDSCWHPIAQRGTAFLFMRPTRSQVPGVSRKPLFPAARQPELREPHLLQLPSGRVIMMIRATARPSMIGNPGACFGNHTQTTTWKNMGDTFCHTALGASATPRASFRRRVLCTYGYRRPPYGQRACLSNDGVHWRSSRRIDPPGRCAQRRSRLSCLYRTGTWSHSDCVLSARCCSGDDPANEPA